MPTAFEYGAAARRMRDAGDEAAGIASDLRGTANAHGVSGGNLQVVVDQAFLLSTTNAERLAAECETLASECDRRAEICRQYADELAAWRVRHSTWSGDHAVWRRSRFDLDVVVEEPGPEPPRPDEPYDWVEVSSERGGRVGGWS